MFTGLIEEVGKVASLTDAGSTRRIVISSSQLANELKTGDSIAVNGVCLTALDITKDSFAADLAAETVERTSLARLATGAPVNLELPTKAGSRLGGHVVQGHVDGVGKVLTLVQVDGGDDWKLSIELPNGLENYVVFKGSISVEGISLTVARVEGREVSIAVIPHTYEATNLRKLKPGDPVNIEVDVIAKYAEKMLKGEAAPSAITAERLMSEGF
ncbi:MAG TPA: riboflavin synthase [Terriglobales bacterium]|nr:riboflavin synthase [Terriglobales bacterium]